MKRNRLKIAMRNAGVKVKHVGDLGKSMNTGFSMPYTTLNKMRRMAHKRNLPYSHLIIELIESFKLKKTDINEFMNTNKFEEVMKTNKVKKYTHDDYKFTSFNLPKDTFHKLVECSNYYGVPRSSFVTMLIDEAS